MTTRMVNFIFLLVVLLDSSKVSSFDVDPIPRKCITTASIIATRTDTKKGKIVAEKIPLTRSSSSSRPSLVHFASTAPSSSDSGDALLPGVINDKSNGAKQKKTKGLSSKFKTVLWIHILSIFMVVNYFWGAFPSSAIFGILPLPAGNFIHATSAMVFSGSIFTTTILEWKIGEDTDGKIADAKANKNKTDDKLTSVTQRLFPLERSVVLPALSLNILSGVAQVYGTYLPKTLRQAPPHIKSVFHVLFLFGLWWGFTDRKSQRPLKDMLSTPNNEDKKDSDVVVTNQTINDALKQRRLSNIVSCGFIMALYAIMIFKPGYKS